MRSSHYIYRIFRGISVLHTNNLYGTQTYVLYTYGLILILILIVILATGKIGILSTKWMEKLTAGLSKLTVSGLVHHLAEAKAHPPRGRDR